MDSAAARQSSRRPRERNGWRLKLPDAPPNLEDARLLQYRHPAERPMLALALAILTISAAGAIWFREKDLLLAVGAIYFSMVITALQAAAYHTLQGAEVTPTQF